MNSTKINRSKLTGKMLMFVIFCFIFNEVSSTRMPIIGILSQEATYINEYTELKDYKSYIAASYVKFVEAAGARALPIWIGRDAEYYKDVVAKTNGVLFPGGTANFSDPQGYTDASQLIYNAALEANDKGDFYPLWGTCLGMEVMLHVALNGTEIRTHCDSKKISLPLEFCNDYPSSRLFGEAPKEIIDILRKENVTMNSHQWCITPETFKEYNLDKTFRYMSTNKDSSGIEFISTYEAKDYPFYSVQFHPEKNSFEFSKKQANYVDHSLHGVLVAQYFANFFVEETRKSNHTFENVEEENERLIYNFQPEFVGKRGSSYQQAYMFTREDNLDRK